MDKYFNTALQHYEQACGIVREMVAFANTRAGQHISLEMSLWKFDAILQTILLNVAVEDGSFQLVEEQFIRKLTKYGDAMVTINEIARKSDPNWRMTWSQLPKTSQKFQRELAEYASKVLDQTAAEFAAQLAPIDSMISRNCLVELRDQVMYIMVNLSLADGDTPEKAKASSAKSIAVANQLLADKWAPYLKHTTSRPQNTTPQPEKKPVQKPTGNQGANQINYQSDRLVNYRTNGDNYTNAVIYIQVARANEVGQGSGVIVTRSGYALTCNHVVRDAQRIVVKVTEAGKEPRFIPATVHSRDTVNDLALIKLEEGNYYYAELDWDRTEPKLGENIAIHGYPFGANLTQDPVNLNVSYCRGYVASNQTMQGLRRTWLDITARSGNSGSPVTSLDNGKVVGIYYGGHIGGHEYDAKICGMTPMQYVVKLISGK